MDDIDTSLLELLQEDDRLSYVELGGRVGLSVSGVNARLRKLSAAGYIRAFAAQLVPERLGLVLCAFIQVVLERPEHDEPFLEGVLQNPAILECHHITGEFSYLLKIRVANTSSLERVISEEVKRLPGVARTHTVIALSSPKETTRLDLRESKRRSSA
jgi:Lrp/AsnC family leucine-responsive transcriptional regulator